MKAKIVGGRISDESDEDERAAPTTAFYLVVTDMAKLKESRPALALEGAVPMSHATADPQGEEA